MNAELAIGGQWVHGFRAEELLHSSTFGLWVTRTPLKCRFVLAPPLLVSVAPLPTRFPGGLGISSLGASGWTSSGDGQAMTSSSLPLVLLIYTNTVN